VRSIAIFGACICAIAVFAGQLGLGQKEAFLLYKLFGIERRACVYLGLAIISGAVALGMSPRIFANAVFIDLSRRWMTFDDLTLKSIARSARRFFYSFTSVAPLPRNISVKAQQYVAVVLSLIATAIFLVLAAVPRLTPSGRLDALPEVVSAYDMVDNSRQVKAYGFAILFIASSVLLAGWLSQRKYSLPFRCNTAVPLPLGAAILGLPLLALILGLPSTYLFLSGLFALVALGVALVCVCYPSNAIAQCLLMAACGLYLLYMVVLGFVGPIIISTDVPYHLAQFETHLAELLLPSSLLASGYRLVSEVTPGYGLVVPTLVGIFERHAWLLDVGDQLRVSQLSQVIFLVIAVLVLYRIRHRIVPMLLPLAMVAPFLTTAGPFIWHPNETGIRSLGFPIGLLVLQSVRHASIARQAVIFGAAGAFLLIMNFETGTAVVAGFAFYFYQRSLPIQALQVAKSVVLALAGALAALVVFDLIVYLGLGQLVTPAELFQYASQTLAVMGGAHTGITLFAAGYQNLNLIFIPLALVMLLHGLYLIVLFSLRARCRTVTDSELFVGATSTILVVWLGYYFNFASPWNMWVPMFLYGVILTATFDVQKLKLFFVRPLYFVRRPWKPLSFIFIFLALSVTHKDLMAFNNAHLAPPWTSTDHGVMLSGVLMPKKLAVPLAEKARFLKEISQNRKVAYLTLNVDFMPVLSGIYQIGQQRNMWLRVHSDAEMRNTIRNLAEKKVDRLLTDDTSGPLATYDQRLVFQQHVERIASEYFTEVDKQSGWKVWVAKR